MESSPRTTSGKGHSVAGIRRAVRLHAESLLPESCMNVRPNNETPRGWSFRQGQARSKLPAVRERISEALRAVLVVLS